MFTLSTFLSLQAKKIAVPVEITKSPVRIARTISEVYPKSDPLVQGSLLCSLW